MARACLVCASEYVDAINTDLVVRGHSNRVVARQYGMSRDSVRRHATNHLRDTIAQSKELRMLASIDSLVAELNNLHAHVQRVLERAERTGNDDLTLRAVAQGRLNVDSLYRVSSLSDVERRLEALEQGTGNGNGKVGGDA